MSDQQLAVVILAAGTGTRMKSATPKVLHELAGVPLLGHVAATARALGPGTVLAVVRHERDRVAAYLGEAAPEIVVVDQDATPGTGRAVAQAIEALDAAGDAPFAGDVLVLSGDVPLLDAETLAEFVAGHRESGRAASILTSEPGDPTGYGRIVRAADGSVDRIVEQKDATDAERAIGEVNSGVYVFGAAALRDRLAHLTLDNAQGEQYLTDVIGLLREAGSEVSALPTAPWKVAGINDRAQLAEAAAQLNALIVRGWQLHGVSIQDPATTWIDLDVVLEPDATILPNTQLRGATVVAVGAVVGPDTTLVDTEVGAGATVKRTDATLAVIGANALVGPFAYLRPGTVLEADGKIGTFVETKNATIRRGAKVPHLSYVGDTNVGEHTNLGAGAITANYDDIAKHRTEIGAHVHTGSHNVFVAPVRIGDGAKTGAGAVIRKDVPPGALAMSVAPQRNIEGWVQLHRAGTESAAAADAAAAQGESSER
ncbi:bifunctional UDP-N-acetylglucosamine diphosphorylase/glucosamine-1-phosphate N-acetyltransferase GlmU [Agromyces seonyuensis]|uniref:Bifunctional protein GlmU n=1 Tax=Agromyces seonyuensis TaxID=2662446 RepID=A0A6I4P674_9MICO|nr:bifunctional UDP-N-acetylglucosamine diphosphorylase/glucosamine-1-phosphate N-acetyltransferase GlmU [Agromyces seonyuensis]MWC00050.1 bifunctional UDP-N-acetylglucosamine diphosphorylase/glucosamine-1-phosphate N-acetyltransferase GlmU [Agromyces seonyuensis]